MGEINGTCAIFDAVKIAKGNNGASNKYTNSDKRVWDSFKAEVQTVWVEVKALPMPSRQVMEAGRFKNPSSGLSCNNSHLTKQVSQDVSMIADSQVFAKRK